MIQVGKHFYWVQMRPHPHLNLGIVEEIFFDKIFFKMTDNKSRVLEFQALRYKALWKYKLLAQAYLKMCILRSVRLVLKY